MLRTSDGLASLEEMALECSQMLTGSQTHQHSVN